MLTGIEYSNIGFSDVLTRLEDALDAKYGRRPGAIYIRPDSTEKKLYQS
jgi:hypothetical protein